MINPRVFQRIPKKFLDNLEKICRETNLPVIYHIKKALSNYYDDYRDYEIALKRKKVFNEDKLTIKEFRRNISG